MCIHGPSGGERFKDFTYRYALPQPPHPYVCTHGLPICYLKVNTGFHSTLIEKAGNQRKWVLLHRNTKKMVIILHTPPRIHMGCRVYYIPLFCPGFRGSLDEGSYSGSYSGSLDEGSLRSLSKFPAEVCSLSQFVFRTMGSVLLNFTYVLIQRRGGFGSKCDFIICRT